MTDKQRLELISAIFRMDTLMTGSEMADAMAMVAGTPDPVGYLKSIGITLDETGEPVEES